MAPSDLEAASEDRAVVKRSRLFASHAYTECGHVAQHFGLPNFGGIQCHCFDSGRTMKASMVAC
jgi:hypothetical protein